MVLYDPANGDFFVRGSNGETISVINASTRADLTTLTVGASGSAYVPNVPTMALDPVSGDLYETNAMLETVGVIQVSTDTLLTTVPLGAGPGGIVFDSASGDLYTSNWYSNNVSVISGTTNQLVGSIHVGGEPGALLSDPIDSEVFVSNFNTGNVSIINTTSQTVVGNPVTGINGAEPVQLTLNSKNDLVDVVNSLTNSISVINGTTNTATGTIAVGSVPTSASFDPSTDTLLVANGASDNITVVQQPGDTTTASIGIGHGAEGAAYDPTNGYVYTANEGSNNVSIVDPSTDTWVGAVMTNNFPEELGVDTHNGNVFVANLGTEDSDSNLTVISGSTGVSIASIDLDALPTSLNAVPNGNLYAIDYGGQDAYIIQESTSLESGVVPVAAPEPDASAYDVATGDLYFTSEPTGTVSVVTATGGVVATLNLGFGSDGVAYDPTNGFVYVSNDYSGNITVINGASETVHSVFSVEPYDSLTSELYDPVSASVYVADYLDHNITVLSGNVTNGSIQVGTDPTSFAYDPENDTIFVANYGSNTISVINASTNELAGSFSGYFPGYLAYDSGTNSLYMTSGENGQVDEFNASTYASLGAPVNIQSSVRSGGIAYSASTGYIYVSNEYDSSISIISSSNVTSYPVTFDESGLAASTTWGVTVGGQVNMSSTPSVGFSEPNGSYPFTVEAVPGYVANVSSGNVVVTGAGVTVSIGFTPGQGSDLYPLTFNETGLRAGTSWEISLTPSGGDGHSSSTAPASIVYNLANGTYNFTVDAIPGFSAAPMAGSRVVAGLGQYVLINFTAEASVLTASLVADPTNFSLGASTELTTSAAGGTSPYSYAYSGLPSGCTTSDTAGLACTPTSVGTFVVTVNVTDSTGAHATAHATFTVHPATGPSTNGSSSSWEWGVLAAVVIIVLLLVLFFFFAAERRKRDQSIPPTSPDGATPPPPGAAP
jgi:YVTN family beta-propeller protein